MSGKQRYTPPSKKKRRHDKQYDDNRDRQDDRDRDRDRDYDRQSHSHNRHEGGSQNQRSAHYDHGYDNRRHDQYNFAHEQRPSDQHWQHNLSRSFSPGSRVEPQRPNTRHLILSCNIDHLSASATKAHVTKPIEIASFSINDGIRTTPGSVKRYTAPTLPIDLNVGFDTRTIKQEAHSNIDPVIATLKDNEIDLTDVHFVSFRNNFNKILGSPYANHPWEIDVYRQENIIYFDVVKLEERNSAFGEKAAYWGYKFEEYCTAGTEENGGFDPNNQFCRLLKLQIAGHNIIIGAEIDCYELDDQQTDGDAEMHDGSDNNNETKREDSVQFHYVELKTAKSLDNFREEMKFKRYKMMNFWIQSFLGDVPEIKVGFRNDNGIVSKIESFQTVELPKYADQWDGQKCLNFASSLLTLLKISTQNNKRYTLTFNHPFTHVELRLSQKDGSFV